MIWPHQNYFSRFDGKSFKTEASSQFPHAYVYALGSYRNSPFVTGNWAWINGLKTEILNYGSGEWKQAGDYPFSNGDRYVSKDFMKSNKNLGENCMLKNATLIIRSILNFHEKPKSFLGYPITLPLQPAIVFWSSAATRVMGRPAIQLVFLHQHQQSPNTKTETGRILATWLKLDILMVQSPPDLSQWLLVVGQIVEQREFTSERNGIISKF